MKRAGYLTLLGGLGLAAFGVASGRTGSGNDVRGWMGFGRSARAQLPQHFLDKVNLPAASPGATAALHEAGALFNRPIPAVPGAPGGAHLTPPTVPALPAGVRDIAKAILPGTSAAAPATPDAAAAPTSDPNAPAPRVAVLATKPGSGVTDLIFQALDSSTAGPSVARFSHIEDTEVQGAVIPTTNTVLVIAGTEHRKDPAFGSSMLLVGEKDETKQVVDRVYHGTRPLILDDGRAIVQRGSEGDDPTDADLAAGRMRVDHLTIDQIDLVGNATKVLSTFDGYIAFVAGALRHEIFVYRVGPDGADIIGVDADTGRERTIVRPLPAFARDFSVDAQSEALLFTNADPDHPGQWIAEKLSVSPPAPAASVVAAKSRVAVLGKMELLERASHPALVPTAWVGRAIALNRTFGGLQVARTATPAKGPFNGGVDVVREFFNARNETWALAVHRTEGQLPEPVVIQANTMTFQRVAVPSASRVDLAGILQQGTPSASRPQIRRIEAPTQRPIFINTKLFKRYVPPPIGPASDRDLPR